MLLRFSIMWSYYNLAKMQKDPLGFGQLQTDPLRFQFHIITTWGLWIGKIDTSTKQPLVFLSKITATWNSRDHYLLLKNLCQAHMCDCEREKRKTKHGEIERERAVRLREKEWERKRHAIEREKEKEKRKLRQEHREWNYLHFAEKQGLCSGFHNGFEGFKVGFTLSCWHLR